MRSRTIFSVKLQTLIVLLIAFSGLSAAEVYYDVEADSSSVEVDTSVKMECAPEPEGSGCPVTRWTTRLSVPQSAEVTNVSSSNGEVSDWEREVGTVRITTDTPPTRSELISASYRIDREAYEVTEGLYTRRISLPGFRGERNSGTVTVEDFISGRLGSGFSFSSEGETVNFTGTGASNMVAASGEGFESEHFEFFGDVVEDSSSAYRIPVGTLGISNMFDRFPVAVMDSEEYNESVNEWSAGQYVNATLYVRDDLGENQRPVLAHEAVHGLNDQYLDWSAPGSWFDEGTAKYVEFLVRKSQGDRTRNVFGEDVTYQEGRYRYTLPSDGDIDRLWSYYSNDEEWMKTWTPQQGNRGFGYAYSELVIRNYVRNGGRLSQLYRDIESTEFSSAEGKWNAMSEHMDLTPCKHDTKERFEQCIEDVNSYDYPVYTATEIPESNRSLEVSELKVEKPETSENRNFSGNGSAGLTGRQGPVLIEMLVNSALDFLQGIFEQLGGNQ